MDAEAYKKIIKSETSARIFVSGFCKKNSHRFCPKCHHRGFWKLKDGRRRCHRCRLTFHDRTVRWINTGNLNCQKWLQIVEMFERELSVFQMASKLRIAYDTAYRAVMTIRMAISAARVEEVDFNNQDVRKIHGCASKRIGTKCLNGKNNPMIYGVVERSGKVLVRALPDFTDKALLQRKRGENILDSFVRNKLQKEFDSLIFYDYNNRHSRKWYRILANSSTFCVDDFLKLLNHHLRQYRGVSPALFPLYLREIEFRYNHRQGDIFLNLMRVLCRFTLNAKN